MALKRHCLLHQPVASGFAAGTRHCTVIDGRWQFTGRILVAIGPVFECVGVGVFAALATRLHPKSHQQNRFGVAAVFCFWCGRLVRFFCARAHCVVGQD